MFVFVEAILDFLLFSEFELPFSQRSGSFQIYLQNGTSSRRVYRGVRPDVVLREVGFLGIDVRNKPNQLLKTLAPTTTKHLVCDSYTLIAPVV
jgi:hypothetical protein